MIYRVYVYLASNEWGNELMKKIADEYAAQSDKRPLVVEVHEHAGWYLSYVYGAPNIADGTTCGTANDAAHISQDIIKFWRGVDKEEILPEIRR